MRLALEKKIIIAIAALAGIAALIIGGVIVPTIRYIKDLDNETYELRVYLEKKYERSLNVRSTLKQVETIKAELTNVLDRLFREGDELNLITDLEAIAAKNAVSQKIISSNLDSIADHRVTMSLTITGDYLDILNYLADIENERYFISITHVAIAPSVGQNRLTDDSMAMNLDISVYVSPK